MSTSLAHRYAYPCDVATAFAALSGEGWAARRAEVLRDGSAVVRREERADGGVLLVVSRALPEGVPGYLERFLPEDGRVTQTDDWGPERADGSRHGTWSADLPGAPARLGGVVRLAPDGGGCTYVIEGTVQVGIPLIGGKAERFLAEVLGRLSAREAEVLRAMLAG